jgi:hypothetical protein
MTCIFKDSFDYYSTITQKYTSGTAALASGSARNGAQGLLQGGVATVKQFASTDEHATLTVGLALRRTGSGTFELRFLSDSVATQHITIQITTTGEIKVFRGSIAGTQLGSTISAAIGVSVWNYLEAQVTLHDTTGVVKVWLNGVLLVNLSSQDTKNAGTKAVFDGFSFAITLANADVDDLYVNNGAGSINTSNLGDVKIVSGLPNADGNTSQLVGSDGNSVNNYLQVDESPANTSDYNGSATNDQYDTYNYANFANTGDTIYDVSIYDYSAKSDAGAKQAATVVRSGGTDYEQATHALSTSYQFYETRLELNPASGVAWSISALNAAEFGFKVKA